MPENLLGWIRPAAFVLGGLLLGILVDRVLVARLRRYAEENDSRFWLVVTSVIGHAPVLWLLVFGASLALLNLPVAVSARAERWTNNGLFVVNAASITLVAARAAAALVAAYTDRVQGALPSSTIFTNLVRLAVYALGALIVLQSLGISITPILTALGVGGLAVALALQDTLSNLFSGLQILASRQFRPGDYIKLASGEEGYVRDITWRVTTVQSLSLYTHVIPNAKLASAIVTNYYQPTPELSVVVPVGVHYDSDLELVERVTVEVARRVMADVEGGIPEYEPLVRFTGFGDSAVEFNVIVRAREFGNQFLVRSELIRQLLKRYRQESIILPSPTRTLQWEANAPPLPLATATPSRDGDGAGSERP
jgi:small-conductance mechanosensitive channel